MDVRKILCPIDFSDTSRAALESAVDLARRYDARVTLLHVYAMPGYAFPDGTMVAGPDVLNQLVDSIEKTLREWRAFAEQLGAPSLDTATAMGGAAQEIVRFAQEGAYDLIVIGTHGRTGLRHVLLGSVAERVVRTATCPVLTVHGGAVPVEHAPR